MYLTSSLPSLTQDPRLARLESLSVDSTTEIVLLTLAVVTALIVIVLLILRYSSLMVKGSIHIIYRPEL